MSRPRLVVLRALGLGDLLTAVPALRALRRAHPDHVVTLATPSAFVPLLEATGLLPGGTPDGAPGTAADTDPVPEPVLDSVMNVRGLAALPGELPGALRRADVAVNLHGRGPQSTRLLAATGPRRLVAFGVRTPGFAHDGLRWRDDGHEVHRWCRLLAGSGIPADPADLHLALRPGAAPPVAGATVVHPGAAAPARRWPPGRFAAVARHLTRAGERVVVTGGPDEVVLARSVAAAAGLGDDAVLAGRTDLPTLASLVAGARRVVCGDTGVAHLATAFGTPSLLLFGPTPPARWGPPADGPHRVLWAGTVGDPHGTQPDPGLLAIGVDDVLSELARADRHRAGPPRQDALASS